MPQADTDGMITVTETEWRETMDQMNKLVRERNAAKRQLSAARKVGRFMCQTATDLADWIEEHADRHNPREIADVRDDVVEILAALTPKRRRRP